MGCWGDSRKCHICTLRDSQVHLHLNLTSLSWGGAGVVGRPVPPQTFLPVVVYHQPPLAQTLPCLALCRWLHPEAARASPSLGQRDSETIKAGKEGRAQNPRTEVASRSQDSCSLSVTPGHRESLLPPPHGLGLLPCF